MGDNKALKFIERHWMQLINLLADSSQRRNTDGCLRLLTDVGNVLNLRYCSDAATNARMLLFSLKNYIKHTSWERERVRCVDVLLLSLFSREEKKDLCTKWARCCLPPTAPARDSTDHESPTVQIEEGKVVSVSFPSFTM